MCNLVITYNQVWSVSIQPWFYYFTFIKIQITAVSYVVGFVSFVHLLWVGTEDSLALPPEKSPICNRFTLTKGGGGGGGILKGVVLTRGGILRHLTLCIMHKLMKLKLHLEFLINVIKKSIDWIKHCFYVLHGAFEQVIFTSWECDFIRATFVLKIFILFGHISMAECMTTVSPIC